MSTLFYMKCFSTLSFCAMVSIALNNLHTLPGMLSHLLMSSGTASKMRLRVPNSVHKSAREGFPEFWNPHFYGCSLNYIWFGEQHVIWSPIGLVANENLEMDVNDFFQKS